MIGGKKFKTLKDAKDYQHEKQAMHQNVEIYRMPENKIYKYFVGTHIQWLNL